MRLDRVSFAKRLANYSEAVTLPTQPQVEGRLIRMVGLTLEAEGLRAALGSRCLVINDDSYHPVQVEAEVMGFSNGKIFLMPVGSLAGIGLDRLEKEAIRQTLAMTNGNREQTAELLGIGERTLYRKLKEYGLR